MLTRRRGGNASAIRGEIAADAASDARASLRRIGLVAIEVRPVRERSGARTRFGQQFDGFLRQRRQRIKADLFDSLSTLLAGGLQLSEALGTLAHAAGSRRRPMRLLRRLQEGVRAGQTLSQIATSQTAWFDEAECAMLRAGEQAGELLRVLKALAERHVRAGELSQRFLSVLTYPAIVLTAGLGAALFLSTRTLPRIAGILEAAAIEPPMLTTGVMAMGRTAATLWWVVPLLLVGVAAWLGLRPRRLRATLIDRPNVCATGAAQHRQRLRTPRAIRDAALADVCITVADLLRVGVPLVEALRSASAVARGLGAASLARAIRASAQDLEEGADVAEAFRDPHWFDAEFRQLVGVGEAAGELDAVLDRIGQRLRRRTERRLNRLAVLAEPAAIVLLAIFVGVVVLAAVLPLVKLQQVL